MKRLLPLSVLALALLLPAPGAVHAEVAPAEATPAEATPGEAQAQGVPASCDAWLGTPRHATCLHAVKHGLTLHAAAVVEGLAERAHAVEFCRARPDPAEARHTESILAGGPNFRALFDEHRARLAAGDIEDPEGWCRQQGLERR